MKSNQKLAAVMALVGCHVALEASATALSSSHDHAEVAEDMQVQTFAEAGLRFIIPCKTALCESYLKRINPSNDWVPFKNDALDTEDEPEPAQQTKKLYPKGSKLYGHVQTRGGQYKAELEDEHLRQEMHRDDRLDESNRRFLHQVEATLPKVVQKAEEEEEEQARQQRRLSKKARRAQRRAHHKMVQREARAQRMKKEEQRDE